MRFPSLRYWVSGTAILGGFMTLYSVWVGFVQMPREAGNLKWLVLGFGVILSLAVWYSLARSNVHDEEREKEVAASQERLHASIEQLHEQNELLLRQAVELAAEAPRIVAQNETTHAYLDTLISLQPLYQQRDIELKGTARSVARVKGATLDTKAASGTARVSGSGNVTASGHKSSEVGVTVTPAPALAIDDSAISLSAENVTLEALDQEIREKEAAVLRHLVLKAEAGHYRMSGNPARLIVKRNDGTIEER